MKRIIAATVIAIAMATGFGAPTDASPITHADRARMMAARSVDSLLRAGVKVPRSFVVGSLTGKPIYQPGTFVGTRWRCGDETCFAGLGWRAGRKVWVSGT